MEKLSRLDKYKALRDEIETGNHKNNLEDEDEIASKEACKRFDQAMHKQVNLFDDPQLPKRSKQDISFNKDVKLNQSKQSKDNTFTNEYIDDFIKEVKEYNIKKGTRNLEDTQIDILSQLKSVSKSSPIFKEQELKKENPTEGLDYNTTIYQQSISKEMQDLVEEINATKPDNDDNPDAFLTEAIMLDDIDKTPSAIDSIVTKDIDAISTPENNTINNIPKNADITQSMNLNNIEEVDLTTMIPPVLNDDRPIESANSNDKELQRKTIEPLFEEVPTIQKDNSSNAKPAPHESSTNQLLKDQMLEESSEIATESKHITLQNQATTSTNETSKTNRLLNIILCIIMLLILIVVGIAGYFFWKSGGM